MYIVFEGVDGVGKTTAMLRLSVYLKEHNSTVLMIKEPSDSNYGKELLKLIGNKDEIDNSKLIELSLKDRIEIQRQLKENINRYDYIISDRSFISNIVYQSRNEKDILVLYERNKEILDVYPDCVVYCDASSNDIITNISKRSEDKRTFYEKFDVLMLLKAKYELFLELLKNDKKIPVHTLYFGNDIIELCNDNHIL